MTFLRWLILGLLLLLVVRLVRYLASGVERGLPSARERGRSASVSRGGGRQERLDGRPPHEVLGVEPNATPAEVREAYQRLIQQYHPDRAAQLAPELQRLAELRTKELNAAYQAMRAGRGMPGIPGGR